MRLLSAAGAAALLFDHAVAPKSGKVAAPAFERPRSEREDWGEFLLRPPDCLRATQRLPAREPFIESRDDRQAAKGSHLGACRLLVEANGNASGIGADRKLPHLAAALQQQPRRRAKLDAIPDPLPLPLIPEGASHNSFFGDAQHCAENPGWKELRWLLRKVGVHLEPLACRSWARNRLA